MKLGVVAALSQELAPTLKSIPSTARVVDRFRFHESPSLIFAAGGVGGRAAAAATLLLADTFKPDGIVSLGFCGALTDDLDTADLVLGGTPDHPADPGLLERARSAAPKARAGKVVTVSKVVLGAEEKRKLAKESGAIVVDMEADAVAKAAKARGLAFLAVKVVIDTPDHPLASSYAGCWPVMKDLLLRPGSVMGMVYDAKRVKIAAERLRDFLVALGNPLPPS